MYSDPGSQSHIINYVKRYGLVQVSLAPGNARHPPEMKISRLP